MSEAILAKLTFDKNEADLIISWNVHRINYQYLEPEEEDGWFYYNFTSKDTPKCKLTIIEMWENDEKIGIDYAYPKDSCPVDVVTAMINMGVLTFEEAKETLEQAEMW